MIALRKKELPDDKRGWVSIVGKFARENLLAGKPGRIVGTIIDSGEETRLDAFKARVYDDPKLRICRNQKWVNTGSEGAQVMLGLGGMGSQWGATVVTYLLVDTSNKPTEKGFLRTLGEGIMKTIRTHDPIVARGTPRTQKL